MLALVLAFVQTAWASPAACGPRDEPHEACKCCEERLTAPRPIIAADCCAIEESPAHTSTVPTPAPSPRPLVLALPALTETPVAVAAVAWNAADPADIEVRAAGPPLWLRTRSLRL